jgi:hypothetical protein
MKCTSRLSGGLNAVQCPMPVAAFVILTGVVLLGSVLAVLQLQTEGRAAPPWPLAATHGLLAIVGLCCLALALRGPTRGLDQGTASFGLIATALITLATLVGGGLFAAHVFKRPVTGIMIGVHATLAVSGFVVLAAYVFVG